MNNRDLPTTGSFSKFPHSSSVCQFRVRSQEFCPGLPGECLRPRGVSHPLLLSRVPGSRKLGQRELEGNITRGTLTTVSEVCPILPNFKSEDRKSIALAKGRVATWVVGVLS